jgi:hypothetical protein
MFRQFMACGYAVDGLVISTGFCTQSKNKVVDIKNCWRVCRFYTTQYRIVLHRVFGQIKSVGFKLGTFSTCTTTKTTLKLTKYRSIV